MKTNIKHYIKVFNNKFFSKKECKLIINSLDPTNSTPSMFYHEGTQKAQEMGNDPYLTFLRENKRESVGNLIKDKWFKILEEYIINWLNKKEKMGWYERWNGYSFPKFMEYRKGTYMTHHCDHITTCFKDDGQPRGIPTLSIITALNDNYSGGEILMCRKYKYKLKTGETMVFPSTFLYPHEIKKITKGTRYSAVSFVY